MPQRYQPQGQYLTQGLQLPSSQTCFQGDGNVPPSYQPYIQPGYGPPYAQPFVGPYSGMNMVWDPSQNHQTFQPNVKPSKCEKDGTYGHQKALELSEID